ncbi:MAG: metallophosphoesterase family protein [Terriglobia bacterium]
MKFGLISDTHGYFDPRLPELFYGVDKILHAGDVGSREVLEGLGAIAPVAAVKGNIDSPELNLPLSVVLQFGDVQAEMLHTLPVPQSRLEAWGSGGAPAQARLAERERFVACFQAATRLVVFGHTHRPCLVRCGSALFVNPGSAGRKRFSLPRCCARADVSRSALEINFLPLEGYNERVPGAMRLILGGSALC